MKVNKLITGLLIFFLVLEGYAQENDSINYSRRLTYLSVGTAVAYTGSILWLSNQWYSDFEKQPFHFFNDSKQWKQVDKVGHLYGAFQWQSTSFQALKWAGLEDNKAILWSAVSSFTFMATIEVLDGFSAEYGASATDLVANTLGIGLYTGQRLLWKDIRIHPKFSFRRTGYAELRPEVLGSGLAEEILKDYNGQSYWLSFDLSEFINKPFPKWLNLAIGYGAEDMIYANDDQNREAGLDPYRQWYVGIDFDLTHIRSRSKFVNTALFFVNMIRIPAPSVEFSRKDVRFHWLY
ncbi:DUF2279 domain-containing protein [Fulvivirga sedimenti]|uniref:YfiM family protein n=1 Tax=Fulvivirga sedimenti TaxID=2879465 RepID=A0A9X1HT69_9BACT|nr:DUF2279 domain-containing protein [Fulvivirga sedimenti]MCA6075200.1 YfiM family protein [Fulvivirga sedimenti]MCA6076377.1 YfiM family protein [Fulvivirga sedimenti]MCA6077505.1 YfiM family protein [Fulvivirga sedimenti]